MKRIALVVAAAVGPALSLSTAHAQSASGTQCGAATVDNTNTIDVNGGGLADTVSLSGKFIPGLTTETDGSSEIEVTFALAGGKDTVKVNGTVNATS